MTTKRLTHIRDREQIPPNHPSLIMMRLFHLLRPPPGPPQNNSPLPPPRPTKTTHTKDGLTLVPPSYPDSLRLGSLTRLRLELMVRFLFPFPGNGGSRWRWKGGRGNGGGRCGVVIGREVCGAGKKGEDRGGGGRGLLRRHKGVYRATAGFGPAFMYTPRLRWFPLHHRHHHHHAPQQPVCPAPNPPSPRKYTSPLAKWGYNFSFPGPICLHVNPPPSTTTTTTHQPTDSLPTPRNHRRLNLRAAAEHSNFLV